MRRVEVSPIRMERNREFSQIRQGHSQRPRTSNMRTQKPTSFYPQNNRSRVTSQLQNSKSQQSPTKVVCVGCYNKQMHQEKQKRIKQEEKQNEKLSASLINEDHDNDAKSRKRHNRELEHVAQYNRSKMQQNKQKRDKQRKQKQKVDTETQELIKAQKEEKQRKDAIQQQRTEKMRRQVQEQIRATRQKREQKKRQLNEPIVPMFGNPGRQNLQNQIEAKYRNDLKDQISKNKQFKQEQAQDEQKRKKETQLRIIQESLNKERIRKQQNDRKNRLIEEELKKHKNYQQKKRQQQKRVQAERENEVKANHQSFIEQKRQLQEIRRKKIQDYIRDLKGQMANQISKKTKENQWLHQPSRMNILQKEAPVERTCDSCQKKYPQSYLTRINEPSRI